MVNNRTFWMVNNGGLLLFYAFAAYLLVSGAAWTHYAVLLAGIILLAHALEIPFAARILRDKDPAMGRLALMTLLFGFTWWLPVKKGVYSAR